ncbi:MAG: apolipoprotein N-acyltransferase, partial [Victivallaceae bacterium]
MSENNIPANADGVDDDVPPINKKDNADLKLLAWRCRVWRLLAVIGSALLFTLAFPPVDYGIFLGFVGVAPLIMVLRSCRTKLAGAFYVWLWMTVWGWGSFYWLYEIEWIVPVLIAPVVGLFYLPWGWLFVVAQRYLLFSRGERAKGLGGMIDYHGHYFRELAFVLIMAAAWCSCDYIRINMFPWNYLSATQWRNLPLIQICRYTGTFGVTFLLMLVNLSLAFAVLNIKSAFDRHERPKRQAVFVTVMAILLGVVSFNVYTTRRPWLKADEQIKIGLVQPDLTQRRIPLPGQDSEALNVCMNLSRQLVAGEERPDLIVWPECAVPVAYNSGSDFAEMMRFELFKFITEYKVPMLIGSTMLRMNADESGILVFNSAILLEDEELPNGREVVKINGWYDKIQRVPYGEYIPFRKFLPEFLVQYIDMNRDLEPGTNFNPIVVDDKYKLGLSICFESVFSYVSRTELLRGANLLLVITNDAWY